MFEKMRTFFTGHLGVPAGMLFLVVIIAAWPALLLLGLDMIGVDVRWTDPWAWLGALLVILVLE